MKKLSFNNKTLLGLSLLTVQTITLAANPVNPPSVPLESGGVVGVKPNIMFIMDDSGSMNWDYMGDYVNKNHCKSMVNGSVSYFSRGCFSTTSGDNLSSATITGVEDRIFDAPNAPDVLFFSPEFNKLYYNPATVYTPGVDAQGNSLGDQVITATKDDIYNNPSSSINLKSNFLGNGVNKLAETYFCNKKNPTQAELANNAVCRRNGIDTPNPFNYVTQGLPNASYPYPVSGPFTLAYFTIQAREFCDANFVNCSSNSNSGIPAPVRWCLTTAAATSATVQSGKFTSGANAGKNICQKTMDDAGGYRYARHGNFLRVNLPAAQETNYANWYAYYRTRMLAMKTAVGLAFKSIDSSKRVGFITISPGSPVRSAKFLPIKDFTPDHKTAFYNKLYSQTATATTPLREALSRVGRYYAGVSTGINSGMINGSNPDPVQYSCQQNYTIVSTDGYWNGNAGQDLEGNALGNVDNVNSGFSKRSNGVYDGGLSASSGTLSDVALYYYQNDLRPAGATGAGGVDVSEDNVPITVMDLNPKQHMVTYAISLGINGFVNYTKDYYKGGNADFENIKSGASGMCSWSSGVCDWPSPVADRGSALDDLWHATVSGRGIYYSAQEASDLVSGLQSSLNSLISQVASSAAAATSSPNITSGDNLLFYTTYRTVKWDGDIEAKTIDPYTGELSTDALWSARQKLNTQVSATSDLRDVYYMRKRTATISDLKDFMWASLSASEQAFFTNKCSLLTQCANLTAAQKTLLNSGAQLVSYLHGQTGYEESNNPAFPLFRNREYILGDIVDTSPVYVGKSYNSWGDAGYASFASSTATRTPAVYAGSNDGQIHAFNANTGAELWAVVPGQMLSKLYKLADTSYATNHQFYVDGPLVVSDAKDGNTWKSVLVSGMGPGGTGYIALDVSNPAKPEPLWEFCKDSTICMTSDSDLGYTYGNPVITKRAFDGKWVVYLSAGYDNPSGKGLVYEVDVFSGVILRKLYTGTGTAASPAGVSKINTYHANFSQDNTAKYLYAGDMDGNVWKWDLSSSTATTATKLALTKDDAGNAQPITSRIELTSVSGSPILVVGTGKYLNFSDYSTTATQSVYAFKDTNTNLGNLRDNAGMVRQVLATSGITSTTTANTVNWSANTGWFFDLTSQPGERVNIDPVLSMGTLNIVSNIPASNACTAGGNAWIYQVDVNSGSTVDMSNPFVGKKFTGGFIVGQVVARMGGSGALKNFITDASGAVTPVGVGLKKGASSSAKGGWREVYRKRGGN